MLFQVIHYIVIHNITFLSSIFQGAVCICLPGTKGNYGGGEQLDLGSTSVYSRSQSVTLDIMTHFYTNYCFTYIHLSLYITFIYCFTFHYIHFTICTLDCILQYITLHLSFFGSNFRGGFCMRCQAGRPRAPKGNWREARTPKLAFTV